MKTCLVIEESNNNKLGMGYEESKDVNRGIEKRMNGGEWHKKEYMVGW